MRVHPWHRRYQASEMHVRTWFLDAPASPPRLALGQTFDPRRAIEDVLHQESERLSSVWPGSSYLVASDARARPVRFGPAGPFPWEQAAAAIDWERSNCWASLDPADPEAWVPLAPRRFTLLALVRTVAAGRLGRGAFVRSATALFDVDAPVAARWFERPERVVLDLLDPPRGPRGSHSGSTLG